MSVEGEQRGGELGEGGEGGEGGGGVLVDDAGDEVQAGAVERRRQKRSKVQQMRRREERQRKRRAASSSSSSSSREKKANTAPGKAEPGATVTNSLKIPTNWNQVYGSNAYVYVKVHSTPPSAQPAEPRPPVALQCSAVVKLTHQGRQSDAQCRLTSPTGSVSI
jgi:hypothetical protein